MQQRKVDFLVGHISLPITRPMPDMIMTQKKQVHYLMRPNLKIRRPTILGKQYCHLPNLRLYGIPMLNRRNFQNWGKEEEPQWRAPYIITKVEMTRILNSHPTLTKLCLFMIG